MNLNNQRRIAAQILKVGENRIYFDPEQLQEIKEAITKHDIRGLINTHIIQARKKTGQSGARARKLKIQKRKGRKHGAGSRKGKKTARISRKQAWMLKIRTQRKFIRELKDKGLISQQIYKQVYKMTKANFFRSRRHIKLYLNESNQFIKKQDVQGIKGELK